MSILCIDPTPSVVTMCRKGNLSMDVSKSRVDYRIDEILIKAKRAKWCVMKKGVFTPQIAACLVMGCGIVDYEWLRQNIQMPERDVSEEQHRAIHDFDGNEFQICADYNSKLSQKALFTIRAAMLAGGAYEVESDPPPMLFFSPNIISWDMFCSWLWAGGPVPSPPPILRNVSFNTSPGGGIRENLVLLTPVTGRKERLDRLLRRRNAAVTSNDVLVIPPIPQLEFVKSP